MASSVSRPPRGAVVVVFRRGPRGVEYLLLHRASAGREFDGDWAWGSPGGAREAGEDPLACANRELLEETGLTLACQAVSVGDGSVAYFVAEAPGQSDVSLSTEHDSFCWADRDAAIQKCLPRRVAEDLAEIADLVGDVGDNR